MKKISTLLLFALLIASYSIAQINFNQVNVEDWVGNGPNEVLFIVDFDSDPFGVDSTFAWGIRFEEDSISGNEMLSLIAQADDNFTYEMLGIFLDNINYFTNNQNYTNPNSGWFSIVESNDGQNWEWNSGISDNIANGQWFGIVAMDDVSWEAEINVPLITSIEHINLTNTIEVYPNPATSQLTIKLLDPSQVILTDLYGHVMHQGFSDFERIDLENFNAGMYVLTVVNGNSTISRKVIVK